MTLTELFTAVKRELAQPPAAVAAAQNFASGFEPGLCHPDHHSHVLCRDDGVVELSSGPTAAVMVDGANQQVTVKGASLSLEGKYVHLHAADGLYFGFQRFNPWWLSPPEDPVSWAWRTAPLVQQGPGALEGAQFLTGLPQPGQTLVSLSTYVKAVPLFGPNEKIKILAENIASLMKQVAAEI